MLLLFVVCFGVLLWVFLGYPLLLRILVRLRGPRPVARADIEPRVSLVISAYNEARVLGEKIENALALDYPREKLQVAVISDASTDGTDDIARRYAERGVTLFRQDERRGKTAGLNRTVPLLAGEVVVFSDANAMYEPDAIRKLVRNFADPTVGCVTGEARYRPAGRGTADAGESAYWNYELQIKRLETAVGSSVGGDGAIYAIRRHLWWELPETAINDFLNPLQIVAAGWRSVYEPEAVCWEETAGGTGREYRRRVRIVSRSWRAIFQAPQVLNPFRVGFFALSVLSHKVLRWFTGLFGAGAAIGLAGSAVMATADVRLVVLVWAVTLFGLLLAVARARRAMALLAYFVVLNVASLLGVLKGSLGFVSGTWAPPRSDDQGAQPGRGQARSPATRAVPLGFLALVLITAVLGLASADLALLVPEAFWLSMAVLLYVYAGYPLVMLVWRSVAARTTRHGPYEPTVCLFVAAHDEESVIGDKIRNALTLDYPAGLLDIVVASDGSTDRTTEIARSFGPQGVRLLAFGERRGKVSVINQGLKTVSAEVVVFSDANTFLEPSAVRALVSRFADPEVGGVSGDVILIGDRAALAVPEDLYYWYERWLQAAESDVGSMVGADGALYAIRRELFEPPPSETILDDFCVPMSVVRAGRRVVFERRALAYEQGSLSSRQEFARKARIVAGAAQYLGRGFSHLPWRSPQVMFALISHKILRWLSPVFVVVNLASALWLAPTSRFCAIAATAHVLVLLTGAAGSVPALRRFRPVGVAHYFCLVHAAAAVGFLRGTLGMQPVMWKRFNRRGERAMQPAADAAPSRPAPRTDVP